MGSTSIEWTDTTWNPVRGCSVISPGCVNCYAMKQAHRFGGAGKPYEGLTKQTKAGPQWTGVVRPVEDVLLEPLSWRKPRRVFVNSMSDLFHVDVPFEFIDQVFAVMVLAKRHAYQVLTKRATNMLAYMSSAPYARIRNLIDDPSVVRAGWFRTLTRFEQEQAQAQWWTNLKIEDWPPRNVWLGVSVENQQFEPTTLALFVGQVLRAAVPLCGEALRSELFEWLARKGRQDLGLCAFCGSTKGANARSCA